MLGNSIRQLRLVGMLEGLSFLALLGIGMPLKYLGGDPIGVKVLGPIHGVLFLVYLLLVQQAASARGWTLSRPLLLAVASLLPFGPFLVDGYLKRAEPRDRRPEPPA